MSIHSRKQNKNEQRSRIEVDAVAARIGARVGTGIHLRIDPGVASATHCWADAKILLRASIRTGA